jgi:predicted AAA+ superfamily ATPase
MDSGPPPWFSRIAESEVRDCLAHEAAVAILGPRQSGKTSLALDIAGDDGLYLDMENPADRMKLAEPVPFLEAQRGRLVVIDEVQILPGLFATLRGVIDQQRRQRRGGAHGMFLLLGSASTELLRQSESLAGRIAYLELFPFNVLELAEEQQDALWVRGGFPPSLLAPDPHHSLRWRENYIRTYLERDIPQLGPRIPATRLLRFWTMLAHQQGSLTNASQLARGLDIDSKTVAHYLDLLSDLMLVRRLPPYFGNVRKRLVKSPKVYVRDSGLVHALLRITGRESLLGHPVVGGSWEGFVIENLMAVVPQRSQAYYYRTSNGAEIDLVLEMPGMGLWAIEIKRGPNPKPEKGFLVGCEDIQPARRLIVNAGDERYQLTKDVEVIGLRKLVSLVADLTGRFTRTQVSRRH